ncbi:hypothetical protein Fsol_00515 [Candidatus Fokinia solitaria]|uniref:Uncharacterized protein n=1 Tax=Candidatus Fokinia solitaria TaxID=1802984 RepID=A0A2U8BSI5_9RICK|nr:hypothetical protein [Candidatus Fokinia solitaria]AWD33309.1 hypothetical protein Fsol_00515 [Candidatus Fokinia solitaria]
MHRRHNAAAAYFLKTLHVGFIAYSWNLEHPMITSLHLHSLISLPAAFVEGAAVGLATTMTECVLAYKNIYTPAEIAKKHFLIGAVAKATYSVLSTVIGSSSGGMVGVTYVGKVDVASTVSKFAIDLSFLIDFEIFQKWHFLREAIPSIHGAVSCVAKKSVHATEVSILEKIVGCGISHIGYNMAAEGLKKYTDIHNSIGGYLCKHFDNAICVNIVNTMVLKLLSVTYNVDVEKTNMLVMKRSITEEFCYVPTADIIKSQCSVYTFSNINSPDVCKRGDKLSIECVESRSFKILDGTENCTIIAKVDGFISSIMFTIYDSTSFSIDYEEVSARFHNLPSDLGFTPKNFEKSDVSSVIYQNDNSINSDSNLSIFQTIIE